MKFHGEPVSPPATEAQASASPELPEELLMIVFGTLEIPDLVRAGSVCTSWRSAYTALRSLGKHKQTQTPCLLYTSESTGDNVACLYSLVEKRVYRLTLPEPPLRRRFLIGSSLGFVITVDDISEMHLVNPITGQQIALPSVTTIEYVKPIFDDSGAVHKYEYPSHSARRAFFMPSILARSELREELQIKAFVFHDTTTGSYIIALIHEPFNHLSFTRVGDDKWTLLPPHYYYQDCTYKDGLLYAVDIKGEIHAFDLSGPAVTMKIIRGVDEDFYPDAIYIVEAPWGGLLLVSRFKEFEDPAEDADPEIYVPHTTEIKLHRVDDGAERLVEIDCLPDHVLFLGHNDPLCLSAKDYPALKGNHAYFTDDDEYNKHRKSSPRDIGVVDLGNCSKEELVSPQLWSNWPSPVWLTPSFTVMKLPSNDRCLSDKDYPALKGNHAYFTDDDEYNKHRKSSSRDIGVVDLGNCSKEDLVSPLLWSNWPSPVWITPSLTAMKQPSNDRWLSGWHHVLSRPSPIESTVGTTTLLELPEDIMIRVFATLEIPDLVRPGVPVSARVRRRLLSNGSDRPMSSDEFPRTIVSDYHDGVGVIAQYGSAGLLDKSVRRYSDVSTRIADPCPMCLTPRTTNRCSQISRRGTFSEDVWMQSTPRKQLRFHSSSSESKRDTHRLPDSPSLRRIRHCSGQCTNGEVEERNGYCDSVQHDGQCHVQSNDTSIEDLKLPPTNSERSDSAGESRSEECRAENEKTTRGKRGSTNCSGTLLFLLVCAVVILVVALLLAWWKEDQRELYVVPT